MVELDSHNYFPYKKRTETYTATVAKERRTELEKLTLEDLGIKEPD